MKNKVILIFGVIFVLMITCIIILKPKAQKNISINIMYDELMELKVYKEKKHKEQIISIPIIVNKKIEDCKVEDVIGKNVDYDKISFIMRGPDKQKNAYMYALEAHINWEGYKDNSEDVKIEELSLVLDGKRFKYKPGTIELFEKDFAECSKVYLTGLGTAYPDMTILDCSLGMYEDVKITDIETTIDLPITNLDEYLKKEYYGGISYDFLLDVDGSSFNKMYYVFNIIFHIEYNGEEYYYTFSNPVQSSLEYRFLDLMDGKIKL